MIKAMRVTMKKVKTIFVRRKTRNAGDEYSMPHSADDTGRNAQIEDGLEVKEDRHAFSGGNSTESSPEPIEMLDLSDEEDCDFFPQSREVHQRGEGTRKACRSVKNYQNEAQASLVPVNGRRQIVPYCRPHEESCRSVVLKSCGDLEKTCTNLPLELQAKISVIKENLLRRYPPFYDFCIIASEEDYTESIKFKEYVSFSFGLAGCTLDDGFLYLGADLFECYKTMMDQSTKVFFFVTENFTDNAFCKRLQSGAVFLSLMSKAQNDKEKCVPVFPHGFCVPPLALSGIAGLNPTQSEVIRRSLENTYSPLLRQRRLVWDREHFKKRCLEFQTQVTRCIEEAKSEQEEVNALQNELSVTNLCENANLSREEGNVPAIEARSTSPLIQMPENDESSEHNILERSHVIEPHIKTSIEKVENGVHRQDQSNSKKHSIPQQKSSIGNTEKSKIRNVQHDSLSDDDDDGDGLAGSDNENDFFKQLNNEITNNTVSSVNIKECEKVHVGHTIKIIINPTPTTDISQIEQLIKTAVFAEEKTSEQHSDSSD